MIKEEIRKLIQKATGLSQEEIQVERPENEAHGDYSTNVALQLKREPEEIVRKVKSDLGEEAKASSSPFAIAWVFERIEAVKPGFINFFISKEYLQKQVKEILKQGEDYGKVHPVKSAKGGAKQFNRVNLEFISANPTGQLHLGHGRGAFWGDILANLLERAGYKIAREYYINDARESNQIKELGKTGLGKGKTYLNNYLEKKIQKLRVKLKGMKDEAEAGQLLAREVQKDIKEFIEKVLKVKFDKWVSEQSLYKRSRVNKIYQWLKRQKLIYKKEGAEWLRTSAYGDTKDWVVIRETEEPTYLLSDIAYHKDKFDRGFNKVINLWGADHQGHVGKIKAAAKMLRFKGDLDILISQVVRLKKGKISKRKGEVVTLEWLVKEVGLDAARFFYITKSLDTQMEFDVELAKEKSQKSPVYYVQYAHARICSILRKAKNQKGKPNLKLLNHPSELNLIRQLIRLPEIIEETARDYQVQRLPQYATDLATSFHQFYQDCRVISDKEDLTQARLGLVSATKIVLKSTLDLMGLSVPEKM